MTDQTENNESKDKKKKRKGKSSFIESLGSLALIVFVVFAFRSSIIEPYKIPSGSMIPTLLIGDRVFVDKLSYGFKIPFTEWFLEEPVYLFRSGTPSRGEIIVFLNPTRTDVNYIKRVIGVPGDSIEIRNKRLFINGEELARSPLTDNEFESVLGTNGFDVGGRYDFEQLKIEYEKIGDVNHYVMEGARPYYFGDYGPITVPDDAYFVMGDNRDDSTDSRVWGFVPMKYVKGRAFVIWLSTWIELADFDFLVRPERIFKILE